MNEDVLEVYSGSPTETRYWLAAMQNPRYLKARGEHLMHAVEGAEAAEEQGQLDLWRRWSLVNLPDERGEGLLAAALRGVEPGDHVERSRLVAYLLDAGGECLPAGVATPAIAATALKRAATQHPPVGVADGAARW